MLLKDIAIERVRFLGQINLIFFCKHKQKKYIQNISCLEGYFKHYPVDYHWCIVATTFLSRYTFDNVILCYLLFYVLFSK